MKRRDKIVPGYKNTGQYSHSPWRTKHHLTFTRNEIEVRARVPKGSNPEEYFSISDVLLCFGSGANQEAVVQNELFHILETCIKHF